MRFFRFSLLSLPLFLLAQSVVARAESLSNIAADLKTLSEHGEAWIPFFQSRADWVMWMTMGVIVLGGISTITSAISAFANAKSGKFAAALITAVITATIAVVTGFKSQVFHADVDSYRAIEMSLRQVVESTKQDLRNYAVVLERSGREEEISDADAEDIRDRFKRDQSDLVKLNDRAQRLEVSIVSSLQAKPTAFFRWPETPAVLAGVEKSQVSQGSYVAWGTGNCNTIYGAREYARYDALRRLALQAEPTASADRLDALINAIEGSVTEGRNILNKDKQGGFVIQQTELSLNQLFLQKSLLRVANGARRPSSFSATATLKPGFTGPIEVGAKSPTKGSEGAFVFGFKLDSRGGPRLQLLDMKVYDSAGKGSTRWSFDVMLGGQRVFTIPMRRQEDSGRPTICKTVQGEKLEGPVNLPQSGALQIEVIGYRPKGL
jgi:hypothetical protein